MNQYTTIRASRLDYSRLRRLMSERHVATSQVAYVAGYSQAAVNNYLKQGRPLPGAIIIALTQCLQLQPAEVCDLLLGGAHAQAKADPVEALRSSLEAVCDRLSAIGGTES